MTLKKENKRFLYISISLIFNAILYNTLLFPLHLVTGGINGISIIIYHLFNINSSVSIFTLSMIFFIISWIYLGKEKTIGNVITTIIYPILIQITTFLRFDFSLNHKEFLIIICAIISGILTSLMYKSNYINGGFPILFQILLEKKKIPIFKSSLIVNGIMIFISIFIFNIKTFIYSVIFILIHSIILKITLKKEK